MSNEPEHPFAVAPAPWDLDGECFWLVGYSSGKQLPGTSDYAPLEYESSFANPELSGKFKGGLLSVMIVRYKTSPVGPYDEIIWSPGRFDIPSNGKDALRITRIYVSSKESVYNGRKNWNICKHHAHFTFVPSGAKSPTANPYSRIEVASPSSPDKPFFVLDMAPTLLFSGGRLPYDSVKFPLDTSLVNPPLPQSPHWREDGEVGTDEWVGITPHMRGKAGLFSAKGGLEGGKFGDGVGFPDITPWSVGMWMREFKLTFPVGTEVGKKDK